MLGSISAATIDRLLKPITPAQRVLVHPDIPQDAREKLSGISKNPNSVAILRCSRNFNAYISKYMGCADFLSRLVSLRILNL